MDEEYIAKRIAQLRNLRNVSARDMSLSIGQNPNYVNHIENGKTMPSMQVFFFICEYFHISPKEFFDDGIQNPVLIKAVTDDLKKLDEKQIKNVHEIIKGLKK